MALRASTRRILALEAEANDLEAQIERWVRERSPELLDESGVGPLTAACARKPHLPCWPVSPIPASSGQVVRYRLNRHEDRALTCTLCTIVLNRYIYPKETPQYMACLVPKGKSHR